MSESSFGSCQTSPQIDGAAPPIPAPAPAVTPAKITLLYESRDGKLCLFEDARGHLFAVPSALLA